MNDAMNIAKRKELDEKWASFFYEANVPFNVARNPAFIEAVKGTTLAHEWGAGSREQGAGNVERGAGILMENFKKSEIRMKIWMKVWMNADENVDDNH
ncbi:MAG: hypothetical protein ACYTX0_57110, partial [Nostoc sp.]